MRISGRIGKLLVSSVALAALGLPAISMPAFAQAPAGKPNIVFIMGDDIGWMQPEHLSSRADGRRNAEHRSHRQ